MPHQADVAACVSEVTDTASGLVSSSVSFTCLSNLTQYLWSGLLVRHVTDGETVDGWSERLCYSAYMGVPPAAFASGGPDGAGDSPPAPPSPPPSSPPPPPPPSPPPSPPPPEGTPALASESSRRNSGLCADDPAFISVFNGKCGDYYPLLQHTLNDACVDDGAWEACPVACGRCCADDPEYMGTQGNCSTYLPGGANFGYCHFDGVEESCPVACGLCCKDDPTWDGGHGGCATYREGATNEDKCVEHEAVSHCPVACGVCCRDNEGWRHEPDGHSCKEYAPGGARDGKCDADGASKWCPAACGICKPGSGPAGAHVECKDDDNFRSAFGNCSSYAKVAGGSSNHKYCSDDNALQVCPLTCGLCTAEGDKHEGDSVEGDGGKKAARRALLTVRPRPAVAAAAAAVPSAEPPLRWQIGADGAGVLSYELRGSSTSGHMARALLAKGSALDGWISSFPAGEKCAQALAASEPLKEHPDYLEHVGADVVCHEACLHLRTGVYPLCKCGDDAKYPVGSRFGTHALSYPNYNVNAEPWGVALFNDPYAFMVIVGIAMVFTSATGLIGVCCAKVSVGSHLLFAYFTLQYVGAAVFLWGATMCLLFRDSAEEAVYGYYYQLSSVDASQTAAAQHEQAAHMIRKIHKSVTAGGVLCIFATLSSFTSLLAARAIMGHVMTVTRTLTSSCYAGLVFGMGFFLLAVGTAAGSLNGNEGVVGACAFFSVSVMVTSAVGLLGIRRESLGLLMVHTLAVSLFTVILFFVGIVCFAKSDQATAYIHKSWGEVEEKYGAMSMENVAAITEDNLNKLGAACFILVAMLTLNALAGCAACIQSSRERRLGAARSAAGFSNGAGPSGSQPGALSEQAFRIIEADDEDDDVELMVYREGAPLMAKGAEASPAAPGVMSTLKQGKHELKYMSRSVGKVLNKNKKARS